MTVHTPSDGSETQVSENTDPSLQALWQTTGRPGERREAHTGRARSLGSAPGGDVSDHRRARACCRAGRHPGGGVLHVDEAIRLVRELYMRDVESQEERYMATAEHALFEVSARFELPGPWRVVPGSSPDRWDVLDAHGLLVAAEMAEAVAELLVRTPQVFDALRAHLTTEDPLG